MNITDHIDPPSVSPLIKRAYHLLLISATPSDTDIAQTAAMLEVHSSAKECYRDALREALEAAKAVIAATAAEFAAYATGKKLPTPIYGMLEPFYAHKAKAFDTAHAAAIAEAMATGRTAPKLVLPPKDLVWWHLHPEARATMAKEAA